MNQEQEDRLREVLSPSTPFVIFDEVDEVPGMSADARLRQIMADLRHLVEDIDGTIGIARAAADNEDENPVERVINLSMANAMAINRDDIKKIMKGTYKRG